MCLSMDIFEALESYSEWAAFLRRLNFELSRNVTRNWAAVKIQSFFRGFMLRRSSPLHNLKFIAKIMKSLQSIPPLPNDDERSKLTEEFKDYLLQLHAIQENNVSVLREAKDAAVMDIFMLMPRDILDDIIEQLRIFPRRKAAFHECLLLNPSAEDEMGIHGGQNSANSHANIHETLENENGKFGYAEDEKDVGVNYEGAVALIEDYFVGEKVNDNGQDDEWVMIPTMDEVESA